MLRPAVMGIDTVLDLECEPEFLLFPPFVNWSNTSSVTFKITFMFVIHNFILASLTHSANI